MPKGEEGRTRHPLPRLWIPRATSAVAAGLVLVSYEPLAGRAWELDAEGAGQEHGLQG